MKRTLRLTLILALIFNLFTLSAFGQAKVFNRGNPDIKEMALTFDDGYSVEKIEQIKNKLNKYNVKGTFFFVGSFMASHKEVVRELEADGHMVVSHSYSHKDFTKNSSELIVGEIENTKIAYNKATGKKMLPYFRPPYGAYNDSVLATLGANHDLYVVMWTIDTLDWKSLSASEISNKVLSNAGNGKIVLMHTTKHVNSDKALDAIITGLQDQGYGLVRVDEMFYKLPVEKRLASIDQMYIESLYGNPNPKDPEESLNSQVEDTNQEDTFYEAKDDKKGDKKETTKPKKDSINKLDSSLSLIDKYLWRLILSR